MTRGAISSQGLLQFRMEPLSNRGLQSIAYVHNRVGPKVLEVSKVLAGFDNSVLHREVSSSLLVVRLAVIFQAVPT